MTEPWSLIVRYPTRIYWWRLLHNTGCVTPTAHRDPRGHPQCDLGWGAVSSRQGGVVCRCQPQHPPCATLGLQPGPDAGRTALALAAARTSPVTTATPPLKT